MKIEELAKLLKVSRRDTEQTVAELLQAGSVYELKPAHAYTAVLRNGEGRERLAMVIRIASEHKLTAFDIRSLLGAPYGGDKKAIKAAENTIDALRDGFPVWMTEDVLGHNVYWLVSGKDGGFADPPKGMDGRKSRTRAPKVKKK